MSLEYVIQRFSLASFKVPADLVDDIRLILDGRSDLAYMDIVSEVDNASYDGNHKLRDYLVEVHYVVHVEWVDGAAFEFPKPATDSPDQL